MLTPRRSLLALPALIGTARAQGAELVIGYPNPQVFREPMEQVAALSASLQTPSTPAP
jgi:hypothetical protein